LIPRPAPSSGCKNRLAPVPIRLLATAGAAGLGHRGAVEDDPGRLAPVGALGVGIQEAQIGDEMRFITGRDAVPTKSRRRRQRGRVQPGQASAD